MRRTGLLFASLLALVNAMGQTGPELYWVRLTDKSNTPYSLGSPEQFLSPRALARREAQGIPIDELDLPVDPAYISTLLASGQFQLHTVSRWFNAVTIRTTDTLALDTIGQLPFVSEVRCTGTTAPPTMAANKFPTAQRSSGSVHYDEVYGDAFRQIAMLNGHLLHELGGARGEGLLIGVMDSGFQGADSLAAFAPLRERGGIVLTRDVVCPHCDVYDEHWHGRSVLSVLAAEVPGKLMGTAPQADYALIRTEEIAYEFPVEEDNWVSGAEFADSLGCDVLNTSLGYVDFDDSTMSHTYDDLDGLTSRMSIAAGIAARKGMIPVQSAGNHGGDDWGRISIPADAIDILAVGAVGEDRLVAGFSGHGPSADGRVKPDVCAVGYRTVGLDIDGVTVNYINGTSFSAPVICGLTACLWQLHRDRDAGEVMDAVRHSASHFAHPNDSMGHGLPDFWRAHLLLGGQDLTGLSASRFFGVYPLPFSDQLSLEFFSGAAGTLDLELVDMTGRIVLQRTIAIEPQAYQQQRLDDATLGKLGQGAYVLRASLAGHAQLVRKLVKAE